MDERRTMLRHFLAALAYRTQKALRGAPSGFGDFAAGERTRTPRQLVRHMTSVLGYARTYFVGGRYWPEELPDLASEVERFHAMLSDVAGRLERGEPLLGVTPEQLLQGPFADAMTHAGQLALLRRLAGAPVPPENFIVADIRADRLGPEQPPPVSPDAEWPEAPCRLRPASEFDKGFLYSLHCVTMHEPIEKTWGWNEAWQRNDFDARFNECVVSIIEAGGRDAGGLWLESSPDQIFIANLQVLPEFQGRGIGTWVMEGLLAEAATRRIPVELSVLQVNPRAQRLYERLGFKVIDEGHPFIRMRHDSHAAGTV
jgi:ribosomal protein S18 acetylase RimI-like enzyme